MRRRVAQLFTKPLTTRAMDQVRTMLIVTFLFICSAPAMPMDSSKFTLQNIFLSKLFDAAKARPRVNHDLNFSPYEMGLSNVIRSIVAITCKLISIHLLSGYSFFFLIIL